MAGDAARLVYFSPTGTTRAIVENIGLGLGRERIERLDLTPPGALTFAPSPGEAVTVLGAPVFAGRLPAEAVRRLRALRHPGGPAVVVVVYGNRAYEDALLELCDLATALGYRPVAAGAFVGEHSFSSPQTPIAVGRPDGPDVLAARDFGRAVAAKLAGSGDWAGTAPLSVPGNRPYRESGLTGGVSPVTHADDCLRCGQCVAACPMGVVSLDGEAVVTAAADCIRCLACVKACPNGARVVENERLLEIARRLSAKCQARREPETYL